MIKFKTESILSDEFKYLKKEALNKGLISKLVLLDAIFQSSPYAYLVVDNRDDSILYFNNQFCTMWGIEHLSSKMKNRELNSNDIILSCLSLVRERKNFIKTCKQFQKESDRKAVEDEILLTDGRLIRRFSDQVRDEFDNYVGRLYLFQDITVNRHHEIELKDCREMLQMLAIQKTNESLSPCTKFTGEIYEKHNVWSKLEKYRLLSENTRDIILFLGMDGRILEANKAAVKNYGYKYKELCNMNILDLRYKEQQPLTKYHRELAYKHGCTFETIHRRKDGSLFPVEVRPEETTIEGQRVWLGIIRDISERKGMEKKLEHVARHDHLTKIPNRYYLEEFLCNNYTSMQKEESALLVMDLDNFKVINDTYGHSTGDKLLISIADCISKKLRGKDFIARTGGDQFAIFLSNTDLKGAQVVANKLLDILEHEVYYIDENNIQINVTASMGITTIDDSIDIKLLFSYADAALYAAKEGGKNRVVVLENGLNKTEVSSNNRILKLIQNALVKDRFQIYLQPVYTTGDVLLHYEVLVRLLDQNDEVLPPSSFIPLAERYSLMPAIDKWVIKNTIRLLSQEDNLNVFINLSGISLCDDALLEWIELTLKHDNVDPKRIGFEITETTAIKDLEKAKMWIYKLKALGCHFALDDFGVGFSSFSYLSILPVDYLKIDGTFVRDLDSDSTKLALVKSMNMVAHALGKKTIAEFVENNAIWSILRELGVDYGQGYYLGKPAPSNHLSSRLQNK